MKTIKIDKDEDSTDGIIYFLRNTADMLEKGFTNGVGYELTGGEDDEQEKQMVDDLERRIQD